MKISNRLLRTFLFPVSACCLVLAACGPTADSTPETVSTRAADLGGPITLSGSVSYNRFFRDVLGTDTLSDAAYTQVSIKMTAELSENVRMKLWLMLRDYYKGTNPFGPLDLEKMIREASIEIRNVGGKPIAFVLGKQAVYTTVVGQLPAPENDPTYAQANYGDVIGFTVDLGRIGFFDTVQLSAFETTAGDLRIGDFDGASIRLSKKLTQDLTLKAAAMHAGHGNAPDDNRGSVGLIYKSGKWTYWANAEYFEGSAIYPNSNWMVAMGARFGNEHNAVFVQASVIENALTEVGLYGQIEIAKSTYLIPQIRYRDCVNGTKEVMTEIRVEYRFNLS